MNCDFIVRFCNLCYVLELMCNVAFFHITVLSSCTTGDVRLVDGDSEMEGRVEVCSNGVWGAVYDSTG